MSEPIYRLTNLNKTYAGRVVLSIQSLEVMRGEILGLIGPSGSGKSTLLRILNFLEPPSSGRLEFAGAALNHSEAPLALRRQVTTVFQHPILLNRSVYDNVACGLRVRGAPVDRLAVGRVLQEVGLEKLSPQRARTLSGGEAQRVALARAMLAQPRVLLLDEPTANLDPYNVTLIEKILLRLNQQSGTTLILVTHNVFQARRLAHRTAFILDGSIVEVSQTEQIFHQPKDPKTRTFVNGEMIY